MAVELLVADAELAQVVRLDAKGNPVVKKRRYRRRPNIMALAMLLDRLEGKLALPVKFQDADIEDEPATDETGSPVEP